MELGKRSVRKMILVSACLAGINCKYDGGNNYQKKIFEMVKNGEAIPVCAEQFGGLTTPRSPVRVTNVNRKRKVFDEQGDDKTKEFEKGAQEILDFAKKLGIKKAILKSKSPSCGCGKIYCSDFSKKELVEGNGVLAELLIENGIEVISSDEI